VFARAAALLRALAQCDEERAALQRELADALEENAPSDNGNQEPLPRRSRGKGVLLASPLMPPTEIDRARARRALSGAGMVRKSAR
jgi:hypothetical protein